jgi:hypothetical protein
MTLVVLSTDGARVGAMTFPSVLAPDAALAESPAPFEAFGQEGSILPLLTALKGLEAELITVRNERLSGRVVGVARVQETAPASVDLSGTVGRPAETPGMIPVPVLVFLTSDGAMRWFPLADIRSVGPADAAARAALERAVGALAERSGEAQAAVSLAVRESGDLAMGYLAEAPVWRVSYRLVFQDGRARIQGWALVHNDTDEDWRNVQVELVEGRPQSFLFPFVTPRFRHRDVIPPEDGLAAAPQLAGTNADRLAAGGLYGYGIGLAGHGYGGGGDGYGSAYGVGGLGMMGTSGEASSTVLAFAESAAVTAAEGESRRELLAYRATEPLSLRAHESALVPILDAAVDAERISVFSDGGTVLSAMKITNDTRFALREGPLAVFDAGFAGQTWLPRLYVGDGRVLPHGSDLDVEASLLETGATDEAKIARWFVARRGIDGSGVATDRLEVHYVRRTTRTYAIDSHTSSDRVVLIRLPALQNGRVAGTAAVEELTAEDGVTYPHVRVPLPAGRSLEREVTTEEGLMRFWSPEQLTAGILGEVAEMAGLAEEARDRVRRAAAKLQEATALQREAAELEGRIGDIDRSLARHRTDLTALSGSGADEDVATALAERLVEEGREQDRLRELARAAGIEAAAAREAAMAVLRELGDGGT